MNRKHNDQWILVYFLVGLLEITYPLTIHAMKAKYLKKD